MKPLNLILGGVMIPLGLFILYASAQMIIHAFRGISGLIQGALITAIGAALVYYSYKLARKQ
jgi:hypothetical protein